MHLASVPCVMPCMLAIVSKTVMNMASTYSIHLAPPARGQVMEFSAAIMSPDFKAKNTDVLGPASLINEVNPLYKLWGGNLSIGGHMHTNAEAAALPITFCSMFQLSYA